ncbi:hypothetical protein SLV14_005255 [Streptomyces sp. Je 1-4]|uniref:hypothetical protein n=1 Tax=Streptomyces TaxID=1883 RepID=UPI0021DA6A98|nr:MULTISPECIES: hypothetical protein [unclassified Streptomyces]UYB42392.1 hypothetical protein SLV14_005255 [Streptomyces sp. Je 1-4]UZQ38695.1 hypothetical protein SLV14N_005255 [Streptomyces sp. Je 1-4] [Streptomyces sp. Je 1-4 4N24]UZQ46112.1 hypothetical protein SLV14NA_005255 [Streptomyces sp. Je 1-4] [Streptomyces sp. Je 1-4 4N24_ara]
MRRIRKLLGPLAAATAGGGPTSDNTPSARGFLTIGGTTYIDPQGSYPLDHRLDGSATLIVNDTDHYITVVTERNYCAPPRPAARPTAVPGEAPARDLVLAPGERAETWRGDSVRVG